MRLSTGAPGQVIGNNRYGIASGQKLGKHSMSTPSFQVISATIISPSCELSCPMSDGLPPFKACAARSKIHQWSSVSVRCIEFELSESGNLRT
jgi:hypothetical protein